MPVPSQLLQSDATPSTAAKGIQSSKSRNRVGTASEGSTGTYGTAREEHTTSTPSPVQDPDKTIVEPSACLEEIARLQLAKIEEFALKGRMDSKRESVRERSDLDGDCYVSAGNGVSKQANGDTQRPNAKAESKVSSFTLISDTAAVEPPSERFRPDSSDSERLLKAQIDGLSWPRHASHLTKPNQDSSSTKQAKPAFVSSQPPRASPASHAKHVMRESLFDRDTHQEAFSVQPDLDSDSQDRDSFKKQTNRWMKQGANAIKKSWGPYEDTVNLFIKSTLRLKEIGSMSETEILEKVAQALDNAIYISIPSEHWSSGVPEFIRAWIDGRGSLNLQLRTRNASDFNEIAHYKHSVEHFCEPRTSIHWLYSIQVMDQSKRLLRDTSFLSRAKTLDAMQVANGCEIYDLRLDSRSSRKPRNNRIILKIKDREAANQMLSSGILLEGCQYDTKVVDNPALELCMQCAGYCHAHILCKAPSACMNCGQDHRTSLCTSSERLCVNCWGPHAAIEDICPIRQRIISENQFPSDEEVLRLVAQSRTWETDFDISDSVLKGLLLLSEEQDTAPRDQPSNIDPLHGHTEKTEPERAEPTDRKQVQVSPSQSHASKTRSTYKLSQKSLQEWNKVARKGADDDLTEESWDALRHKMVQSQQSFAERWTPDKTPSKPSRRQPTNPRSSFKPRENPFSKYIKSKEQPLIPVEDDHEPKWNEFPANAPHLSQWWASDWNATDEDGEESLPVRVTRGPSQYTYTHRFGKKTKKRPENEQRESLL